MPHRFAKTFIILTLTAACCVPLTALPAARAGDGTPPPAARPSGVGALGKIMPLDGFYVVSGPTNMVPCKIKTLLVHEGDVVKAGDPVALVDSDQVVPADVAEQQKMAEQKMADYTLARSEYDRYSALYAQDVVAKEALDEARKNLDATQAALGAARDSVKGTKESFSRSVVVAPVDGTVLDVRARNGETIPGQGENGIVVIGRTDVMMVWAEVYETDIGRVRVGQKATAACPALPAPVTGTVERIGLMIEPPRLFSTDPAYNTGARVVKVRIRLDAPKAVMGYSGMMVQVRILSGS